VSPGVEHHSPVEHPGDALCSDCGDWFADYQLSPEDAKGDRYCEDCRDRGKIVAANKESK
jgi:hypothetical protein